jgi:dsRNA-specific ribonuclease
MYMTGSSGPALPDLLRSRNPDANRIIPAFVLAYNTANSSVLSPIWEVSKEEWYRFAFIGDRVLNLVVSQALYARPGTVLNKGRMTKILSGIVSNGALDTFLSRKGISVEALIPASIDIQKKRGQRTTGTAFEALIGALYHEIGIDEITFFLTSLFSEEIRQCDVDPNPKGTLKELLDRAGRKWEDHVTMEKTGLQHEPRYQCTFTWVDSRVFTGNGRREIDAEQAAARAALKGIKGEAG